MRVILLAAFAASSLCCANAHGQLFVPDGLPDGALYRILFVTEGVRDATSSNIAYYDAFVQSEADRSPLTAAATWMAMASVGDTAFVDRVDSIEFPNGDTLPNMNRTWLLNGVSVPQSIFVYHESLNEYPPANINQFGEITAGNAWTGSKWDGTATGGYLPFTLGNPHSFLGEIGIMSHGAWFNMGDGGPTTQQHHFYALSDWLTVGSLPSIQGDFDGNGIVTMADFEILLANLAGHLDGPMLPIHGDLNEDGMVDLTDFGLFKDLYPSIVAAHSAAVPEMAAWQIAAVLIGGILLRRCFHWRRVIGAVAAICIVSSSVHADTTIGCIIKYISPEDGMFEDSPRLKPPVDSYFWVSFVEPRGPAYKAGIRDMDIITHLSGKAVPSDAQDALDAWDDTKNGTTLRVTYRRPVESRQRIVWQRKNAVINQVELMEFLDDVIVEDRHPTNGQTRHQYYTDAEAKGLRSETHITLSLLDKSPVLGIQHVGSLNWLFASKLTFVGKNEKRFSVEPDKWMHHNTHNRTWEWCVLDGRSSIERNAVDLLASGRLAEIVLHGMNFAEVYEVSGEDSFKAAMLMRYADSLK